MKKLIGYCFLISVFSLSAQEQLQDSLSYQEYLGFVKQHHPLVKQAHLTLNYAEAKLLKSRGGFDPEIAVDYNTKEFKNTNYYNELNTAFKVPTWYGVEFKANFERNSGAYLDPSLTVPEDGLYSVGVSVSLAKGLLMNERMASLKKAKFFNEQSKVKRDLLVNDIIYQASIAYFKWLEAKNEEAIIFNFFKNAQRRFIAIKRSAEVGDLASIDSVEAKITLKNRALSLESAKLKSTKAALVASNYLWVEGIPLEIKNHVVPKSISVEELDQVLMATEYLEDLVDQSGHPKVKYLDYKIEMLDLDKRLKSNNLLPRIDVQYNFLSEDYSPINSFNTNNYKAFITVDFPIFLRKERGDLKMSKIKVQEATYERSLELLEIQNNIDAAKTELTSLNSQRAIIRDNVANYQMLLQGEERKFGMGESSLFLINSREKGLISARLKENNVFIKQLTSITKLFKSMGRIPENMME